ncbi:MAG: hypothetical protein H7X77_05835, partial [Anaerolineae bacterium]|nr:hypothetical protein [Anaerolineae bacterium]
LRERVEKVSSFQRPVTRKDKADSYFRADFYHDAICPTVNRSLLLRQSDSYAYIQIKPIFNFSLFPPVYQEMTEVPCDYPAATAATIAGEPVSQYNGHFIASLSMMAMDTNADLAIGNEI